MGNEKRHLIMIIGMFCLNVFISNAQNKCMYEYECDYFDKSYSCPIQWFGDTLLVVNDLFNEIILSNEAVFTFRDSCVYLTIDGQEGLFWGNRKIGSWNITGEEHQRFTIKWDSVFCTNDTIFKFEFIPYYQEKNPYRENDGTESYHHYCDMTSYYWTRSEGIIAFEGEWLFVRKDQKFLKQCLKSIE